MRPALVLALVAALTAAARAETFTVASGGDDGGPGSAAAPWATLQHAADVVDPGDTVIVRAGGHAGFDLRRSGAAGAPITRRRGTRRGRRERRRGHRR